MRGFMFIEKHPTKYFDILIVTSLVLESSTRFPVCRHEIPSRHVFRGSPCQNTVSYWRRSHPRPSNQVIKKSPSQARSATSILYGILSHEFAFSYIEITPHQRRHHRIGGGGWLYMGLWILAVDGTIWRAWHCTIIHDNVSLTLQLSHNLFHQIIHV